MSQVGSVRTQTCPTCGSVFSYPCVRGRARTHCSSACRERNKKALHFGLKHAGQWPRCTAPDCSKQADGPQSRWCRACREQMRRTGGFGRKPHKGRTRNSNGYYTVVAIGHPLANEHGRVYEHRLVLYQEIGPGEHKCHWCGALVRWLRGQRLRDGIVSDHLDGDKANNAPDNLVAACHACNSNRGLFMAWVTKHVDDPVLWRMYERAKADVRVAVEAAQDERAGL